MPALPVSLSAVRPVRPLLLLALAGCATGRADDAPPPAATIAVQTVQVGAADGVEPLVATGTLAAKEEVVLSFKVGGVIQSIAVHAGDRVRAGQRLATLGQAEIANQVAKARLARDKAARDLARVQALYADSVATLEQLQDATTGVDVAQADVGIAEFNQRYAVITAPADGFVLERSAEANQLVAPGAPVLRLRTAREGLVVRVGLPDRDAGRVRIGDAATVVFDAVPGQLLRGAVAQVGVGAAARTGTVEVEIRLRDLPADRVLASGLVGRATITPAPRGAAPARTAIPIEALVEAVGDTAIIFTVAQGGVARRRQVVVTALEGAQVVLRDPLPAGTQVITAGAAFVVDGSRVTLAAPVATSDGAAGAATRGTR
jgi:RND family efflux transporter MFP subunit